MKQTQENLVTIIAVNPKYRDRAWFSAPAWNNPEKKFITTILF